MPILTGVLSGKDWGDHPSSSRVLDDSNAPYNYYDYIDAWFRFFLYQTPNFDHSWFVTFDRDNL
jgi:hypothetical protein